MIRVGLLLVLVYWCFTIAEPFLVPIVWGMIIAVAVHPGYDRLRHRLGERGGLAAWIVTLLLLVVLIVPLTVLSRALIDNGAGLAAPAVGRRLLHPRAAAFARGLAADRPADRPVLASGPGQCRRGPGADRPPAEGRRAAGC